MADTVRTVADWMTTEHPDDAPYRPSLLSVP